MSQDELNTWLDKIVLNIYWDLEHGQDAIARQRLKAFAEEYMKYIKQEDNADE